jgi:hypothetical protein
LANQRASVHARAVENNGAAIGDLAGRADARAVEPDAAATPPAAVDELPSDSAVAKMLEPTHGDLDQMVERRYIRMLVTFSKTNYFLDGPSNTERRTMPPSCSRIS